MEFLNNEEVREAQQYFLKRLSEDDKLSLIALSHGDDWDDIHVYMDESTLVIGSELTSNLHYDEFFDITNISFFYEKMNDVVLVKGTINFRREVVPPAKLELSNGKFKCPYNELNVYKHYYKHVDYEQTIMAAVESVTDMIDLVIEILQKLYEKGRK